MTAAEKKRSSLCHLITDFHSVAQRRVARFDFWGAVVTALIALAVVEFARLLVSR
jgi:hypothetical protein